MAVSGYEMFRCIVCQNTFSKESSYKMHQLDCYCATRSQETEIEVKATFTCEECGKSFKKEKTLKIHVMTHGGKIHKCSYCGKFLSTKDSLRIHMVIHSDENYKCEECGRYYALRENVSKHDGQKNHVCEECENSLKFLLKQGTLQNNPTIHDKSITTVKSIRQNLPESSGKPQCISPPSIKDETSSNIFITDGIVDN